MLSKNLKIIFSILVLLISLVICAPCGGKIIYVDAGSPGANDGTSWADAYNYFQDALADANAALKPVEIRVAQGIYKPDQGTIMALRDRSETFQLINGVAIFGGYAGFRKADPYARDIDLYESILSGDLSGNDADVIDPEDLLNETSRSENSYQIVTGSGMDQTAVLDGFTITGGNANVFTNRDGAGLLNEYGSPQIVNCKFIDNSAQYYGGGIYNYYGNPTLVNCTFTRNSSGTEGGGIYNYRSYPDLNNCTFNENSASSGGGIYNGYSSPRIIDCTFTGNTASSGAGIYDNAATVEHAGATDEDARSKPVLVNCTFNENTAEDQGGGIYSINSSTNLTNCIFSENSAGYGGGGISFNGGDPDFNGCLFSENTARYGGGMYNSGSNLTLTYCKLIANSGYDYGGGMYNIGDSNLSLNNCIITGNRANSYGGGMSNNSSNLALTNCTFTGNSARNGSFFAFNSHDQRGQSTVGIIDCILWDDGNVIWINDRSTIAISYSDIRGGWIGAGNIDADPLFADPNGPDDVPGTEDDDLRLAPLSPCVDTGDPNYAPEPNKTDIGGNPRIVSGRVDMGAYEFLAIIYVDNQAYDGPEQADLLEDGSEAHPFDTIQEAINIAKDMQTVLVRPGVYSKIDFMGKAITVAGHKGAPVISEPWDEQSGRTGAPEPKTDAVTFHTGEGPDSVIKNFIIRNSSIAISLNYGSNPTITNLTIVDNDFGISAYENSNPDISNCIFWNNKDGDLFQCQARYSCFQSDTPGEGNICGDPLFVDPANGDYHLMSEGWRWNKQNGTWIYDLITSPCIDAGDPVLPLGDEPLIMPRDPDNEYGLNMRIDMGAYGGTSQASMPPLGWPILVYETDPPEPNPARWAPNGEPREFNAGDGTFDYWVQMTSAEAADASGPVEYLFECTTDAGFSSEWQTSRDYVVRVGRAGQGLRFRVKARDRFGNETAWSEELSAD
jgi:parallel beta-helix repeat protein/predicted outer membrane repeat protein